MSKITKTNMPRSMPTIAAADETDACFDTIELRERERERERSIERDAPSSDERVRPIPDLGDHVGNVSLFSQNLESQEPKPGGQKNQIQCHHAQF
jgi:hypothetical protein